MKTISFLFLILILLNTNLFGSNHKGNLSVNVSGFENNTGVLIIYIFRKEDDIFDNKPYRQSKGSILKKKGQIIFSSLPYGQYSIMAIHDEDNNGIMNHNILNLPIEKFGFSNDWNFSIFSGKPTFDKTRFIFSTNSNNLDIVVK